MSAPTESDLDLESVKPRRRLIVAALGVVAAAAVLFFVLRPGIPPASSRVAEGAAPKPVAAPVAPTAIVHLRIQSSPAGANVLDERDGSVLGMTPLQKSYPQAKGTMGMILRLAGYKDKSIVVALDGNSSTSVDLERVEAAPTEATPKPAVTHAAPRKTSPARKPPKPMHDEEEEWRVH